LATTERLLREGHLPAAQLLEERARDGLGQLQRGIDRAAERIVGDDTEALRLARSELDELIEQLEGEITEGRDGAGLTRVAGGQGRGADDDPSEAEPSGASDLAGSEREGAGANQPGGGEARMFFENPDPTRESGGGGGGGPVTGTGYREWLTRLGEVEALLDSPDLRSEVSRVRDRVRTARSDYRRHGEPPRWELVEIEMAAPLSGVRDRLIEELARRQSPEALVPIDRDLVPPRYLEVVRRYYENLGAMD
jgi:hypothetical protein